MGVGATLERGWIDGGQRYATTGDELVLKGRATGNLVGVVDEGVGESVELFLVEAAPRGMGPAGKGSFCEIGPQTLGEVEGTNGGELLLGVLTTEGY